MSQLDNIGETLIKLAEKYIVPYPVYWFGGIIVLIGYIVYVKLSGGGGGGTFF